MIGLFQLLFITFGIFVISQIFHRHKIGLLSIGGTVFWIIVWLLACSSVLWPNLTQLLASYFGIGRGTDFVVYSSLAIMFFVLFRLHIKIESIERDITKAVRTKALLDVHAK